MRRLRRRQSRSDATAAKKRMSDELPDSKIPWWDNEYEGTYSDDPEDGCPYDMGTKVQE